MQQLGKCQIIPLGWAIDGPRCRWLPAALKTNKKGYTSGQSELHTESCAVTKCLTKVEEGTQQQFRWVYFCFLGCTLVFGLQVQWRLNSLSWLTISRLTLLQIFVITRTLSWCYQEVICILEEQRQKAKDMESGQIVFVWRIHGTSKRIKSLWQPQVFGLTDQTN